MAEQNDASKEPRRFRPLSMADIRFLLGYIRPYRARFTVAMIALLGSSLTGLAFPGLTGALIDAVESPSDTLFGDLDSLALLFLLILVGQSLFSFVRTFFLQVVAEKSLADLRQDLYEHLLHLPFDFFSRSRVGELTSRLGNDVTLIQTTMTTTISEMIRQSILLVGGIALVTYTSPRLTLVIVGAIPIVVGLAVLFGRYIRRISKVVQDEYAALNTTAEETLGGISVVKGFAAELFEIARYGKRLDGIIELTIGVARARAAFVAFVVFLLFGGVVGVVWYGGQLVQSGELSIGELTSFVLYAAFVGGAMGSFADLYGGMQRALGAAERIREILGRSVEVTKVDAGHAESAVGLVSDPESGLSIVMKNVHFAYPTRPDLAVLDGVDLEVPSGTSLAIVGPSGAGKSTIMNLLLRFYDPDSGAVVVGGSTSSSVDVKQYRQQFAVVAQEVVLFGGTIAENIAYGLASVTEQDVREAARQANALEFIDRFPEKLETIVGERGVQLSGGQRQRIAVARALIRSPKILLLDEATSALDSESESLVQEALDALMRTRTSVVIAHRLSTVRNVDRIAVLENGKIVEIGTYAELAGRAGPFSSMLERQSLLD